MTVVVVVGIVLVVVVEVELVVTMSVDVVDDGSGMVVAVSTAGVEHAASASNNAAAGLIVRIE